MTVDLRSDTVTTPSAAMRDAMRSAAVGDDVYGEDPTTAELEAETAALLGKEAGLFFPSGTQSNQCALMLHAGSGDEVWAPADSHLLGAEQAAHALLARVHMRSLSGGGGRIDVDALPPALAEDDHYARTRLLCLENTSAGAGGAVVPQDHVLELADIAARRSMRVHLDGARLWNAAVASRKDPAELARPADTVSVCFSKGLGAPVGSLLAGSASDMRRARRIRKLLGGGMRQTGVLAAACLYALRNNLDRLADDHRRARDLARALDALPGLTVDVDRVETNIVLVETVSESADDLLARLEERGVLAFAVGPRVLRFVTHADLDDDVLLRAADTIAEVTRR
jgi:threonine aldolase